MNYYRPRGTLARAIFEKVHNDQYLDTYDTRLVSTKMKIVFFNLNCFNFLFS